MSEDQSNQCQKGSSPNEQLANRIGEKLEKMGLIAVEDKAAVICALATGSATQDEWRLWVEKKHFERAKESK